MSIEYHVRVSRQRHGYFYGQITRLGHRNYPLDLTLVPYVVWESDIPRTTRREAIEDAKNHAVRASPPITLVEEPLPP